LNPNKGVLRREGDSVSCRIRRVCSIRPASGYCRAHRVRSSSRCSA